MRHTVAMQVLDRFYDLLEEDAALVLGDSEWKVPYFFFFIIWRNS